MWIHYERLHNHNKAKHNKTVCIFLGIYCKVHTVTCHHLLTLALGQLSENEMTSIHQQRNSHGQRTVYPKKYAHGFVVLCFVVVMQSFIMNSHEVFIHIHQGYFAGTGAIVRLPQCQWSKPDGYGKISQCITTLKHSKAKTVCIFLGIYCISFIGIITAGEAAFILKSGTGARRYNPHSQWIPETGSFCDKVGVVIDWLGSWLVGWLDGCLVDWLIGWLIDWLIDWLIYQRISWLRQSHRIYLPGH